LRDLLSPVPSLTADGYRFRSVDECVQRGVGPTDVVHELAETDALGLKPRVRRALREQCLLIDPTRLWLRALARAAYRGTAEALQRPDAAWLEVVVHDSIRDLLGEDQQEESQLVPPDPQTQHDHAMLTELLGIPQNRARLAAVRFNGLPFARRRIAFRTVVEGWSLDRCVAEGFGAREHVEAELREALGHVARTREQPIEPRIVDEHGEPFL